MVGRSVVKVESGVGGRRRRVDNDGAGFVAIRGCPRHVNLDPGRLAPRVSVGDSQLGGHGQVGEFYRRRKLGRGVDLFVFATPPPRAAAGARR